MAKAPVEIRSLARSHTSKAMATLVEIMRDKEVNASARVSAAQVLLDRGWGKPAQTMDMTVRRVTAKELPDDELADIATGGGEGTDTSPIDPAQLN